MHFTAFHPDFRMRDRPATPLETLLAAYDIAKSQGIKYVYVGNVHDPAHDSTYCPHCSELLIQRNWYELGAYHLTGQPLPAIAAASSRAVSGPSGTVGPSPPTGAIADYAKPCHAEPAVDCTRQREPSSQPNRPQPDSGVRMRPKIAHPLEPPRQRCWAQAESGTQLTERQEHLVFARRANSCVAGGRRAGRRSCPIPTLDGAASISVMGAFVTLKRSGTCVPVADRSARRCR